MAKRDVRLAALFGQSNVTATGKTLVEALLNYEKADGKRITKFNEALN